MAKTVKIEIECTVDEARLLAYRAAHEANEFNRAADENVKLPNDHSGKVGDDTIEGWRRNAKVFDRLSIAAVAAYTTKR